MTPYKTSCQQRLSFGKMMLGSKVKSLRPPLITALHHVLYRCLLASVNNISMLQENRLLLALLKFITHSPVDAEIYITRPQPHTDTS